MRVINWCAAAVVATVLLLGGSAQVARAQGPQSEEVVKLWPGQPPGTEGWTGGEVDYPHAPQTPGTRWLTNITMPTLTIYRPLAGRSNGSAIIVAPGGAFQFLAISHEGNSVAQWLAERG